MIELFKIQKKLEIRFMIGQFLTKSWVNTSEQAKIEDGINVKVRQTF